MLSRLTPRPRFVIAGLALLTLAFALLFAGHAQRAKADANDNTNCWGHIDKGTPDPNDPTTPAVEYTLQCDGPITGYSINTAPERQVQGTDTEVFVTYSGKDDVIPTDSFSCNGTFPGFGVNCVNPAGGGYHYPNTVIKAQFYVDKDPCAEPKLDPIVTVAYAQVNAKNQPLQSLAGPFDLGFSRACGKTKAKDIRSGKHRKLKIPPSQDQVLTGQEGT